jgi:hypothetical protein
MCDLIDEQLTVTTQRISEAVAHHREQISRSEEGQWLETCAAREAIANALATAERWPLVHLGLSATEHRVLWVLIAQELDPEARTSLRELATESDVDLSHDVLRRVVYGRRPDQTSWGELSPDGRLRRSCLIEAIDDVVVPTHRATFRISRRVLALVHGETSLDRELCGIVDASAAIRFDDLVIDAESRSRIVSAVQTANNLVIVSGPDGSGRRSLLTSAVRTAGRDVLAVDCRSFPATLAGAERQLRLLARECVLFRRVPLLLDIDALAETDELPERLPLVEAVLGGSFVLATSAHPPARRWKMPPSIIQLSPLSGVERAAIWKRCLPQASDGDAELLSTLYPIAPGLISLVATVALAEAKQEKLEPKHISTGMRRVLDDRLAGLATRVTTSQEWNDLVLPEDQTMAVVEFLARVRSRRRVYEDWGFARKVSRGLGVTALFSGPPGTGKTMCAGLIAKDLGTELYQVDLGKIVSKWVGETEKNLGALFDAAEASHAVLLFDEADSLFGKRTSNVTSSNDRYANQETNFLLQRIESFAGICILTTNHDPAIDEAFQRRLSVRVRFPLPDEDERERLWRAMIPSAAPVADSLDLNSLAKKYVMAGGNIRNAVLRAAFLAADANESIGDYHLRQAAQLEYEGMGKLVIR